MQTLNAKDVIKNYSEEAKKTLEDQDYSKKRVNLGAVRETLPQEVFHNPVYKGILLFLQDLILFGAVFTSLWLVDSWYLLLPLWVLSGLMISALFVVGHDAAHGALFKSDALNYFIGTLAFLPSHHAYNQWAYGHNRIHHGHTVKLGADFVWHPVNTIEYKKLSAFKKLMHRLYWSIIGGGIYYMIEIWLKGMVFYKAPAKNASRDKLVVFLFAIAVSSTIIYFGGTNGDTFSWATGLWFWFKMYLVPFIAWNYYIGITVYVHHINPDIRWKKHSDWTPFHGQMIGTINYHIPKLLNIVLHNIYVHLPHHVHMKIPCYNLRKALEIIKINFKDYVVERNTIFADYIRSTQKCKLIHPETGEWMGY